MPSMLGLLVKSVSEKMVLSQTMPKLVKWGYRGDM